MTDNVTTESAAGSGHMWEIVSLVALCAALGAIVYVYVRQSRELTDRAVGMWDRVVTPSPNGRTDYGQNSSVPVSDIGEASEPAGGVG